MAELLGTVVKLDRGYPLVRCDDDSGAGGAGADDAIAEGCADGTSGCGPGFAGSLIRCEHAIALVKGDRMRAAIGDRVLVSLPEDHDKGIISAIQPRKTAFVRKDPAERTAKQVLAANFDLVIIAEPVTQLNRRRLERELVLAHETGASVAVVLTKSDLAEQRQRDFVLEDTEGLAGNDVRVLLCSVHDVASIESVRALVPAETTAILIGKSGVGKSSLVNCLVGHDVQDTANVRMSDGKGRHTTVDRVLVNIPGGGAIVDMPGVRGLGLWDADQGLKAAFSDVESLAASCRFRDCTHSGEPGCEVMRAVESGALSPTRLESYRSLSAEIEAVRAQREQARHIRGEKASDRKARRKKR